MTASQNHGFLIESALLNTSAFRISDAQREGYTSEFDVPAERNHEYGIPGSIKSSGAARLELGSGERIIGHTTTYQLLFASWHQASRDTKVITTIHDFIIDADMGAALRGALTPGDLHAATDAIRKSNVPDHRVARQIAKQEKKRLDDLSGIMTLHPKIDSKVQRRWQANVTLDRMVDAAGGRQTTFTDCRGRTHTRPVLITHQNMFFDLTLPFEIPSAARERRRSTSALPAG